MRKRTSYTLLAVLLFLSALAALVVLRAKAPPEAARLLPESDAIVYLNLKPIRAATHFDRSPIPASPTYQQFIDATGIVAERDLDVVAVAIHAMPNAAGPNGPVAFTIIWQGRFDRTLLSNYLASLAKSREVYAGDTIYSIPSTQGYTDRVALIGYDTVATSNMPTPEQIHSIIDRHRAAASPFAGSSLLAARYRDVPAFSTAWAVGHIGLPFVDQGDPAGKISVLGLELPLPVDTTFVASLRPAALNLHGTSVELEIDQIAPTEQQAEASAHALSNLLALGTYIQRAQQPSPQTPSDVALRKFMESIEIHQRKDRAVLTATIPAESLKSLTAH